jgi:Replicase family/Primase C terminal 1 (PriCT-1)/Homeodomain-like domain
MGQQLELFKESLAHKPYCSNDLGYGLKILPKSLALQKKYLQHNKPLMAGWIVLDCDKAGAFELAGQKSAVPPPNFIVYNQENGHCHIFYGLKAPVCTSELGRLKPLKLLSAIELALLDLFESDPLYTGLISKNPTHNAWELQEFQEDLWELGELQGWLDLNKSTKSKIVIGVGRNCTIFDTVRKWAYKNVLSHRIAGNLVSFQEQVYNQCYSINSNFLLPLLENELQAIAKSIAKWVWKKYTGRLPEDQWAKYVADTHTPEIQAKRGKKGGKVGGRGRDSTTKEKQLKALSMRSEGMTYQQISDCLGVPLSTVARWCKKS